MFRRLGRAALRAVFDQKSRHDGRLSPELVRALKWWLDVLGLDLVEKRQWRQSQRSTLHLFTDASSTPGHLGAVMFYGGCCLWCHLPVQDAVYELFKRRRDQQIMALELLAISMAIDTFADHLRDRRVVIHCDNKGSEACIRRGSARSMDHAQIVHAQWLRLAELGVDAHIVRVASEDNIADLPSRRDFNLFEALCAAPHSSKAAVQMQPVLSEVFQHENCWEELQERWRL